MQTRGDKELYKVLKELEIFFDYHEHPPVPTVEEASMYWDGIDSTHCKNLFFRNHKGNKHYLVISYSDFEKFLIYTGNSFEYLKLYDQADSS